MCVHACKVTSVVSDSVWPYGLQPARLLCPRNQDNKTGVGCHVLLQGIFLTQRSNPCLLCLLHWQAVSLPLAPPGKPSIRYTQQQNELEHQKRPWFKGHYNLFTMKNDKIYYATDTQILHSEEPLQIEKLSMLLIANSLVFQKHNTFFKRWITNILQ